MAYYDVMSGDRTIQAMARIESALARIEAAAAAPRPSALAPAAVEPDSPASRLVVKHEALRENVTSALKDLDRLIEQAES